MKPDYVTKAMIGKLKDALKDHPKELEYLDKLVAERDYHFNQQMQLTLDKGVKQ